MPEQSGPDWHRHLERCQGLCSESRFEEAVAAGHQALEEAIRQHGERHPSVAQCLCLLGAAYLRGGDASQAEKLLRRALFMGEAALPPGGDELADVLFHLGAACHALGKLREAKPLYERALSALERAHGAEDPSVSRPLRGLARVHSSAGDFAGAEPLLRRCHSLLLKRAPNEPPAQADLSAVCLELCGGYLSRGELARSELLLNESLEHLERYAEADGAPTHAFVNLFLEHAARLYEAKGESQGPGSAFEKLEERAQALLGGPLEDAIAEEERGFWEGLALSLTQLRERDEAPEEQLASSLLEALRGRTVPAALADPPELFEQVEAFIERASQPHLIDVAEDLLLPAAAAQRPLREALGEIADRAVEALAAPEEP
ncbi:MAG: tetratricopeptide repeat protein [Myxococcales bacterium]|nr:tetratricopeptide repeat protein [Myxococcales bacterium]